MFETAELGSSISKKAYDRLVPELRTGLLRVQNEVRTRAEFPVIIVIAGVDGAGKGDTTNVLHEWMDPRYLDAHAFGAASDEEAERPHMWRFWRLLPPRGRTGTFFGSWYTDPILGRVYGQSSEAELDSALQRINAFEKQLVDDGALLIKFWFHVSKEFQKKRFEALARDPKQSWRVTERDWDHFKLYDQFVPVCERALRGTSTGEAPWVIVEGADPRYRNVTVGQHVLQAIDARLQSRTLPEPSPRPRSSRSKTSGAKDERTILDTLDLTQRLDSEVYREQLEIRQGRLNALSRRAQEAGVSTLLVFEGWDAAGKGGVIRRVTQALDARFYNVVPIAALSDEELAHHYLWRFWRHLPRAGRMTIFDRSWYGRVLVERVEGLTSKEAWLRSYKEINDFEEQLCSHGIALAKFWLHISKDEQKRRFEAREKTAYKQYKITDEDYRNRKQWNPYREAVHEMVARTSTSAAPWTLVEANDKRFARIRVLDRCCESLEAALDRQAAGEEPAEPEPS